MVNYSYANRWLFILQNEQSIMTPSEVYTTYTAILAEEIALCVDYLYRIQRTTFIFQLSTFLEQLAYFISISDTSSAETYSQYIIDNYSI